MNKILINNRSITDADLTGTKLVTAKINYNYGQITKTEATLTINLVSGPILDQDIANTISNINYEVTITKGETVENLGKLITGEFIQAELTNQIAANFNPSLFKLSSIISDTGSILTDNDLTTTKIIVGTFNYGYNTLINILPAGLTIIIE